MRARSDTRNWQFSSTAATLLVAYLLVLQGFAVNVSAGGRAASGLLTNAICFSKPSGPLSGDPATPTRPARHGDVCCVVHCASLGGGAATASPFVGEAPPSLSYVEVKLAFDETLLRAEAATPPLGSRAPPVVI